MKQTDKHTLRVVKVGGEMGRYRVESRSGEDPHLVDILEHDCNGECSCEYFTFKCRPNYTRLKTVKGRKFKPIPYGRQDSTQCVHLVVANMSAWWEIKRKLAKAQHGQ